MNFKINFKWVVYAITVILLSILFGFGSYVKDLYIDTLLTSSVTPFKHMVAGGIVPADIANPGDIQAYFEKINLKEKPDTFIVISSTEKTSEKAPIVTQKFSYKTGYGDVFYDNILLSNLLGNILSNQNTFFAEDTNIFTQDDQIAKFVPYIKKVFPDAQVVPVFITASSAPIDLYKFGRLLKEQINQTNKHVFVLGLSNSSQASGQNIRELHNAMFERVLNNFDIEFVDKLEVGSQKSIKTVLYYLNNQNAKTPLIIQEKSGIFAYFTRDSSTGDLSANPTLPYSSSSNPSKLQRITLLGFGDIMLDRSVRILMDANGLDYPFRKIADPALKFMQGTDFVFANHEGPIHEIYTPTSKSIAFRFKPDVVWELKKAGINIVSVANNHALDQGWGGRDDTMKFLTQGGISFFGNPKNIVGGEGRDSNEKIVTISGAKVAFLGFDDTIFKIDSAAVGEYIKGLKARNDFVIVSVHWGVEYTHNPGQRQKDLAHMFIDSGADIVFGHHPHVIQTMEIYNNKPIFYSMGNFVFDQYFSTDTQEGLSVGLVLEKGKTVLYLFPYSIPRSQPTLMAGDDKINFFEKFISWGDYDEDFKNRIRMGKIEIAE